MYRKPLVATTVASRMGALSKLGIPVEDFYESLFETFANLADQGEAISPQCVDVKSLIESMYTEQSDAAKAEQNPVVLPISYLSEYPKPAYYGNCLRIDEDEVAILHPLGGFVLWLNITASDIWGDCDGNHSVSQIVDNLQQKFPDEQRSRLENDTLALIEMLIKVNLLEWR